MLPWHDRVTSDLVRHAVVGVGVGAVACAVLLHPSAALGLGALALWPRRVPRSVRAGGEGWVEGASWALALGTAAAVTFASGGPLLRSLAWAALGVLALRTLQRAVAWALLGAVRLEGETKRPVVLGVGMQPVFARHPLQLGAGVAGCVAVGVALAAWASGAVPAAHDGTVAAILVAGALWASRGAQKSMAAMP